MKLRDFLEAILGKLQKNGIKCCVLRNYQQLPDENTGGDIDLLIPRESLARVIDILQGTEAVTLIACCRGSQAVYLYFDNVEWERGRALQVDLVDEVAWKGLTYLDPNEILRRARPAPGRSSLIQVPSAPDEAIISLFSSYLIGGFIKEKYHPFVRSVFREQNQAVQSFLVPSIGALAGPLIDAVVADDRSVLFGMLPKIRRALLRKYFLHQPVGSTVGMGTHYLRQARIMFTAAHRVSIALFGPDGSGKSTLANRLAASMTCGAEVIEVRHLKPEIFFKSRRMEVGPVTTPHGKPPRSAITSIAKVLVWALELWLDRMKPRRSGVTLTIWDRYYHDLFVDPIRYRYGVSIGFARFVGRFIPQPDVALFLDAPTEVLRGRKQEVSKEETTRQLVAYEHLASSFVRACVIDVDRSLDSIVEEARAAVIREMASRAKIHACAVSKSQLFDRDSSESRLE